MLAGFEQPTSGRILIDGVDMTDVPPYERPVNLMFQSYALFPHMTVAQNVGYGLKKEGVPAARIRERVAEMLALVKLEPLAGRKPDKLSGGEKQRVALARALVKRPKLLLLDEPLAALDKKLREHTQFELSNLQYQLGTTFVVVTHDQDEAMTLAGRIAVMAQGRIAQVGTPGEVYEYPANRYVADFVGNINLIDASRDGRRERSPCRCAAKRSPPISRRCRRNAPRLHTPICVAVRPEKITISRQRAGGDGSQRAQGRGLGPGILRRPVAVSRAPAERRGAPGERAEPASLGESDRGVGRRGLPFVGRGQHDAAARMSDDDAHRSAMRAQTLAAAGGDAALRLAAPVLPDAVPDHPEDQRRRALVAQPPFTPLFEWGERGIEGLRVTFENYAFLFQDGYYGIIYLSSLKMAAIGTLLCLLLGYPMAYYIARQPARRRQILLLAVILPFWISFLLRVYAWIGLLNNKGVINDLLMGAGVIDEPLTMLYNDFAVYLGIVYSYLPFMILPLYANLERLDLDLLDAAADLGAKRWQAFVDVTLPLVAARHHRWLPAGVHPRGRRVHDPGAAGRRRHADDRPGAVGRVLHQPRLAGRLRGVDHSRAAAGRPDHLVPARPDA